MGNYEQKQRINVSCSAMSVLDSDYELFGASSRSGFYNRILSAFFDTAKASVDVACERYEAELQTALPANTDDKVMRALITHYRRRLCAEMESYPQGDSVLFRLNNDNYERLYNEFGEQLVERDNYTTVGKYLKALLEEYSRLAPAERERVYYAELIDQAIQPAIDAGYALEIHTGGGRFLVTPYAVMADAYSAHLYLTGISRPMNDPEAPAAIASFRLSRIEKAKHRKSVSHRRLCLRHSGRGLPAGQPRDRPLEADSARHAILYATVLHASLCRFHGQGRYIHLFLLGTAGGKLFPLVRCRRGNSGAALSARTVYRRLPRCVRGL